MSARLELDASFLSHLDQLESDFVVIAHNACMSFHPLEQVIGNPLQIPESDIVQPEEPLVFRPQARCIHGFHEALVAQLSLYVFQMQNREQAGMTGPDQDLGRLPACLHVIDSDAGQLQFLIGRVEETR